MTTEEAIITRECQLQNKLDDDEKVELFESLRRESIARHTIIARHGNLKGEHMVARAMARAFPKIWNGEE